MTLTDQQRKAVETLSRNVLVTAGAGAGKTHVLIERYIEILRRVPDSTVANLIAVTYTRKAASEMRTRLKARFHSLLEEDGEFASRWARCLAEIDSARIGTIHALCESILKAFPAESRLDPKFEVLDDLEQAELLAKSVDQALREVVTEQAIEHELLLKHRLDDIRIWLNLLLTHSIQFDEALQVHEGFSEEQLLAHADRIMHETQLRGLRTLTENTTWNKTVQFLSANPWTDHKNVLETHRTDVLNLARILEISVDHCIDNLDITVIDSVWDSLTQLRSIKPGTAGGRTDEAKAVRNAIKQIKDLAQDYLDRFPKELTDKDKTSFRSLTQLMLLHERALKAYSALKLNALKLDFSDLISRTSTLLDLPNSAARKFFNATVKAILVDEFQDTNAQQAKIIGALAGDETRLFLIGDDKQSIYKFQGADVSTFNEWKYRLQEEALLLPSGTTSEPILGLNRSFRSHPSLVNFVNVVFSKLMTDEIESRQYKASFQALQPTRTEEDEANRVNVVLFGGRNGDEKQSLHDRRLCEGKAIAKWIKEMVLNKSPVSERGSTLQRPIRFRDFAVLVQRNNDFDAIEAALAQETIPYVMLGGKGFLNRQEVYDIDNLLSFLANPLDSHALLGALRSPIFAITDDLIHIIMSTKPQHVSLWQSLQQLVELRASGFESIHRAVMLLNNFISDAAQLSIGTLVRKIILKTHYDLVLLSLPNGRQRSRNLWKVAALAAERDYMSCGEFAKSLKLMRQFDVKQSDSPLDTGDSVKLMTIHSSKGLEFPAVALPVLGAKILHRQSPLLYHRQFGVAFNDIREADEEKPSWYRIASQIDEDMELEERKRLLYVAMTRARDYLGIFLEKEAVNQKSFRTWLKDALQLDLAQEEEGMRSLRSEFGQVEYSLSHFEPTPAFIEPISSIAEEASQQIKPGVSFSLNQENGEDTLSGAPKLDLIDPIDPIMIDPPSAWSGWSRVTPSKEGAVLDQTIIGTFFHSIMEYLAEDLSKPSDDTLIALALAQGASVAHPAMLELLLSQGKILLDKFFDSELFILMKSAKNRYKEIPYAILVNNQWETRRPDLILKDSTDQWHLVDYKTDSFDLNQLEHQVQLHRKQLDVYTTELQKLTNIRFSPSLYFAQHGLLKSL